MLRRCTAKKRLHVDKIPADISSQAPRDPSSESNIRKVHRRLASANRTPFEKLPAGSFFITCSHIIAQTDSLGKSTAIFFNTNTEKQGISAFAARLSPFYQRSEQLPRQPELFLQREGRLIPFKALRVFLAHKISLRVLICAGYTVKESGRQLLYEKIVRIRVVGVTHAFGWRERTPTYRKTECFL